MPPPNQHLPDDPRLFLTGEEPESDYAGRNAPEPPEVDEIRDREADEREQANNEKEAV